MDELSAKDWHLKMDRWLVSQRKRDRLNFGIGCGITPSPRSFRYRAVDLLNQLWVCVFGFGV